MAKFNTIHEFFLYVKKDKFMKDYTDIKPTGGFNHRFSGKKDGQEIGLKLHDVNEIDIAIGEFMKDAQDLRDRLSRGEWK